MASTSRRAVSVRYPERSPCALSSTASKPASRARFFRIRFTAWGDRAVLSSVPQRSMLRNTAPVVIFARARQSSSEAHQPAPNQEYPPVLVGHAGLGAPELDGDAGELRAVRVLRLGRHRVLRDQRDTSEDGAALIRDLAQRGYALGRNVLFERRGAMGHPDQLRQLAQDLAAAKVDVIVTWGYPAALAAHATGLPTVTTFGVGDPVATGLIASLARPGGNVTGASDIASDLSAKRLELLKEAVPALRRVAMLWNADDLAMTLRYEVSASVAERLGARVQPLGVREPEDFAEAFAAMERERPDAILMVTDTLTNLNRKLVFDFAARHRLPVVRST